jgi:dihydrofolate synthase/folylpolyglutamate synthase
MRLGLGAIDAVCERLDRPERRVPSVLVAGTNGKGSAAATLSAIARAGGLRAGLYTSPHLSRAGERIRVEETDLSDDELDSALAPVFRAADGAPALPLTYFEALTAAAFGVFAERRLDLAILEVGLGGRYDATNVAPAALSVVTSIDLDHTDELGPTREAIAREKAGIFRPGKPALIGPADAEPRAALADAARWCGAIPHFAAEEVRVSDVATGIEGTRFAVETPGGAFRLAAPLPGRHQAENVALAVRAAELLSPEFAGLGKEAIVAGTAATRWPGRLEKLSLRGRTVLVDGCHNPAAAAAIAQFLEDAGLAGRARLVFGAMADKDIEGMAARLFPGFSSVRLVPAPSARAATVGELLRRTAAIRPDALSAESLEAALAAAAEEPDATPIIVAGSLYLVGLARELLLSGRLEDE